MYRHLRVSLLLALAIGFTSSSCRADVVKVVIDDTIHPLITEHIDRAIQEAQRTHADALLIELRTPGGLLYSTSDIIHSILDSPVSMLIYVTPSSSTAASAGVFILESAEVPAIALA